MLKRNIIIGVIALLVAGAGVAGAMTYVNSKLDKIERVEIPKEEIYQDEEVVERLSGYTNIALFGVDSRNGIQEKGTNTDTIMIASINNDTSEVRLISVYRDTYLDLAGEKERYNKANSAYSYGGASQAINMLNKNLDLNIDDFVTVDFKALSNTIDLLGGVEIEMTAEEVFWTNGYTAETKEVTEIETEYLPEGQDGTFLLNGVQATSFCRIRYTAGNDYRRTERQRMVLEKLFEKAKAMDLSTLNNILDEVLPQVLTSLSSAEILKLGTNVMNYEFTDQMGFPFNVYTKKLTGKGDCVIPEDLTADVAELHRLLFPSEDEYQPSATVQAISSKIKADAAAAPASSDTDDDKDKDSNKTDKKTEDKKTDKDNSGSNKKTDDTMKEKPTQDLDSDPKPTDPDPTPTDPDPTPTDPDPTPTDPDPTPTDPGTDLETE